MEEAESAELADGVSPREMLPSDGVRPTPSQINAMTVISREYDTRPGARGRRSSRLANTHPPGQRADDTSKEWPHLPSTKSITNPFGRAKKLGRQTWLDGTSAGPLACASRFGELACEGCRWHDDVVGHGRRRSGGWSRI